MAVQANTSHGKNLSKERSCVWLHEKNGAWKIDTFLVLLYIYSGWCNSSKKSVKTCQAKVNLQPINLYEVEAFWCTNWTEKCTKNWEISNILLFSKLCKFHKILALSFSDTFKRFLYDFWFSVERSFFCVLEALRGEQSREKNVDFQPKSCFDRLLSDSSFIGSLSNESSGN